MIGDGEFSRSLTQAARCCGLLMRQLYASSRSGSRTHRRAHSWLQCAQQGHGRRSPEKRIDAIWKEGVSVAGNERADA